MKKYFNMMTLGLLLGASLTAAVVYAGNQYNWATSTGGAWSTPDDTLAAKNSVLQIGASGGASVVTVSSMNIPGTLQLNFQGAGILPGLTIVQLAALTPGTTGQIAFCNNCTISRLVVSSGVTVGAWVAVSSNGAGAPQ